MMPGRQAYPEFFYHFILSLEGYIAAVFIASASDCASLTYTAAECIFCRCTKLALHLCGSFLALCDCAHGKLGLGQAVFEQKNSR